MQNIKIGKFVDNNGEKINDTERVLAKFDIRLRDTSKEWRNIEDVIDDIAKKWDTLTSVEKDAISVAVAG